MRFSRLCTAALVVGTMSVMALQPAAAVPMTPNGATAQPVGHAESVRYRHGWHHGRHHGWNRGPAWRHHRYGYGGGAALGGLAAGAIIGGAIANSQAQAAQNNEYCSQRFKSYDPSSGTYLGYDGQRHPCP